MPIWPAKLDTNHSYTDQQKISLILGNSFMSKPFHNHFSSHCYSHRPRTLLIEVLRLCFSFEKVKKEKRRLKANPYVKKICALDLRIQHATLTISFLLPILNLQCHGQHFPTHWEAHCLQQDFRLPDPEHTVGFWQCFLFVMLIF